jgi:uncharacterized protein (DUF1778 family)
VDKAVSRSNSRQKTETIQVRATPAEKALLKAQAEAFGISLGQLVRETIFRSKPKSQIDLEAIQTLALSRADLGRVGGMLKGWLVGSFPNSPKADQAQIHALLRKIEIAQAKVLDAVKNLAIKS